MSDAAAALPAPRRTAGDWLRSSIFVGFQLATVILVCFAGLPTWDLVLLCAAAYFARMFGITGGFHRYFAHRTFKTSRAFQFFLGVLGTLSLQKGPIWWASHHRIHHRYSDEPRDPHSPVQKGFLWSHIGWILHPGSAHTEWDQVKDLSKYPELRLLEHYLVWLALFVPFCAVLLYAWSFEAMVYGAFVSTTLLYHGTFTINSLCHVWGKRVYGTTDDSRNNFWLALITMGEGWHNNHHYYQSSAQQGFHWWQIDCSYYVLWICERLRLVWDLRRVPDDVVQGNLGGRSWLIEAQAPSGLTAGATTTATAEPPVPAAAALADSLRPSR